MSNIHGLGKKKDEKKDNKKEEEFSVGGGSSSTAVMRPTNNAGRGGNDMNDIIQRAKNQTKDDQDALARNAGTITMYANGFQIGESPFRDSKQPENKAFLEALKKGELPSELEPEIRKVFGDVESVGINLVDKSSQVFEPPKPKFDFRSSQGQSLGGSNPQPAQAHVGFSALVAKEIVVDESNPTTTLQLVLHNRQRLRQKFNLSHTVGDVYAHIKFVSKHPGPFSLVSGFPPKPLQQPDATIQEAGLAGSSVEQRL